VPLLLRLQDSLIVALRYRGEALFADGIVGTVTLGAMGKSKLKHGTPLQGREPNKFVAPFSVVETTYGEAGEICPQSGPQHSPPRTADLLMFLSCPVKSFRTGNSECLSWVLPFMSLVLGIETRRIGWGFLAQGIVHDLFGNLFLVQFHGPRDLLIMVHRDVLNP
jgi:hypothetical protein